MERGFDKKTSRKIKKSPLSGDEKNKKSLSGRQLMGCGVEKTNITEKSRTEVP